jgi:hypothetical protein
MPSLYWSSSWLELHVPPLQLRLAILISSLLILMFPCLSKPSPEAQESSLNLPGQLSQIAYPGLCKPYPNALPGHLTRVLPESYPSTLPNYVLLTRPYPIALPGRVTPYWFCPRSFTWADNLPPLSLVDLTISLLAKFGLHLTQPTSRFYLYQPLTRLDFPTDNPFFAISDCDFTSSLLASYLNLGLFGR